MTTGRINQVAFRPTRAERFRAFRNLHFLEKAQRSLGIPKKCDSLKKAQLQKAQQILRFLLYNHCCYTALTARESARNSSLSL